MTPTQELIPKTDETAARDLLERVDGLLVRAKESRQALYRTYVEIGLALDEVETTGAWILVARSYDSFIKEHCEPLFGKSRTQLYSYRAIAKNLLPAVTKEQLIEMGVTRAIPLAQYTKLKGRGPSQDLINRALDKNISAEEFESHIAQATHQSPEQGKWHQIPIKATADEWSEIQRAMTSALAQGPLPEETSEPTKNKVALLRLSAEFLSTYPVTV